MVRKGRYICLSPNQTGAAVVRLACSNISIQMFLFVYAGFGGFGAFSFSGLLGAAGAVEIAATGLLGAASALEIAAAGLLGVY